MSSNNQIISSELFQGNYWRNCSQEEKKGLPAPKHPIHIQRHCRHCSENWAWLQPHHNCYLFLLSARHTGPASQGKGWRLGDCNRKCFLLWNTLFRKASKELPKAKCQENASEKQPDSTGCTYRGSYLMTDTVY